jgi:hypothetical protein
MMKYDLFFNTPLTVINSNIIRIGRGQCRIYFDTPEIAFCYLQISKCILIITKTFGFCSICSVIGSILGRIEELNRSISFGITPWTYDVNPQKTCLSSAKR